MAFSRRRRDATLQRAGSQRVVVRFVEVRSISHWFPYDRVGVVNADL